MSENLTEVLMPLMGEGITEATLVKWLKKPGDKITKEEPLLEVSTDKVDTEIPAPASGTLLETFAAEGATVAINSVIAHIAGAQSTSSAKAGATATTKATPALQTLAKGASQPSAARTPNVAGTPGPARTGPVKSSPLVRKIANEKRIDLGRVLGSGLAGRITRRDIDLFIASGQLLTPSSVPATSLPSLARLETKVVDGAEFVEGVRIKREKMTKMRQLTAEHMIRSVQTSPHVTTVFEMDLHKVVAMREAHKESFAAREGFNLTFTQIFIHAATQAIKKHPIVNVSVDGTDILWKDQINIGCAVAIESGLIVPVIKNAGSMDLKGIARALNDIVIRARSKKLKPDDVQGGTFSITNPGMFGSVVSAPIINQPQVAILSIGAVLKKPVVIANDQIGVRPLIQIGLTFDHRVIDGEGGARYLATLKEILESYEESPL